MDDNQQFHKPILTLVYPKIIFANKFYMYNGLSWYYSEMVKRPDCDEEIKASAEYSINVMQGSMETISDKVMNIFKCDPSWPICTYDFAFKNENKDHFVYKVKGDLTKFIIRDDYFLNISKTLSRQAQKANSKMSHFRKTLQAHLNEPEKPGVLQQ